MPKPEKTTCIHLKNGHTCKVPGLGKGIAVTAACIIQTPVHDPRFPPGCLLQEQPGAEAGGPTVTPAFGPQPTRPR